MTDYRSIFLALFITIQMINYASLPKVSKHWNNGFNRKRPNVGKINHKGKGHV